MRAALVAGIDYYEHVSPLYGCVEDAYKVAAALERHGRGDVNFDCQVLTGTGPQDRVDRRRLRDEVERLFQAPVDVALFYFAGHGALESTGGYLCASDTSRGDEGLSLADVIQLANKSPATNRVVILDSCHSGIAGSAPGSKSLAALAEGMTVLAASTADQYASEEDDSGVFTTLLVDALHGGAANLAGAITPGAVYAYIDQSLGAWEQRPVFKTNIKKFVSLRSVPPPIPLADLRRIADLFPRKGAEFALDPSYEPNEKGKPPGAASAHPEHVRDFLVLQSMNRVNLVVPVDADHMWNAAIESKACRLTVLGEHYRRLVVKGRI